MYVSCLFYLYVLTDHICTHLAEQFSSLSITATSILQLVPSVMRSKEINLSEVVKQYSSNMPSPELVDKELLRWKSKYSSVKNECLSLSPSVAIKECDADLYPNLHVLQIACTIPVTSCECERSASVLRRLNNYTRSCMGKERLANLALLHIHYEQIIDVELVVDTLPAFILDDWSWIH